MKFGSSVHHRIVKLNTRVADSLILATFNLCLALTGFALLPTSYSAWLLTVCWVLLPPLLVITLFFGDVIWPKRALANKRSSPS
jgi:hypothetical protein